MVKENPDLVTVNVRLFASLREIAGKGEVTLQLLSKNGVLTVGDLKKRITEYYPAILSLKIPIAAAVNGSMANDKSVLTDRDEIALLPPISGGRW
jgi:molybdopterin converting factor subunit 1